MTSSMPPGRFSPRISPLSYPEPPSKPSPDFPLFPRIFSPKKLLWGWVRLLILALLLAYAPPALGEGPRDRDSHNPILLGMSTALTGPAAVLGQNMWTGISCAIEEVNRRGGIRGSEVKLIALDDGYEPSRTAPNMRRLIETEHVLAIVGNVGTPTAVAAIPLAGMYRTPFFGAFSGAGVLRKTPPDRYVINYRASYAEETTSMVDALMAYGGLTPREIAFFTQRDAYGDAGYSGGISALKRHGLSDENSIVHSRYERNTQAVENGLADIILSNPAPKAVIMVGAYSPCSAFIRLAKQSGFRAIFLNVSFVGTEPLSKALGTDGEGVIITQVVPHFDSDLPIVREYRQALRERDPAIAATFGSLEGYIVSRILWRALESTQAPMTQEAVVDALERLGEFDMGLGERLRLNSAEHQACHRVWPTILHGGKAHPFDWRDLPHQLEGKLHEQP